MERTIFMGAQCANSNVLYNYTYIMITLIMERHAERGCMFNESQLKAIGHEKGPAMVLAGPGTGKTTVITHRVKRLIEKGIAKPEKILVVTFTKAAALEMQERFEALTEGKDGSYNVSFGTFHSVFYHMLKQSSISMVGNSVLTDNERYRILREIVLRLNVDTVDVQELVRRVSDDISKVKGSYGKCEEYQSDVCEPHVFERICKEYDKSLRAEKKIDFDDMVWKCNQMLNENSSVLEYWQGRYSFILVDEFQDINRCQYENIKLLAGKSQNIFVVGDDDQSIYGFRGAGPELMFEFQREFKDTALINLKVNYRSPMQIIQAADNLIRHNTKRYEKNIISNYGKGQDVDIREFENNILQYEYISGKIKEYTRMGIKSEEIAILVRNNESVPMIRSFLFDKNIKVDTGKRDNLFRHQVAKDILSYIQAAHEDIEMPIINNKSLAAIINKPERYISRQIMIDKGCSLRELKSIYKKSKEILENLKKLEMHLMMIKSLNPYAAVNYIWRGVGYERYVRNYAKQKGTRYEDFVRIYNAIIKDASRFSTTEQWLRQVEEGELDIQIQGDGKGIQIITMHAAKGLEYPVVFIPDVNQGGIPGMRAVRDCDVDEERRVFYVALTRASRYLHVYSTRQVMGRKCQKSQFVKEMCSCLHFWH